MVPRRLGLNMMFVFASSILSRQNKNDVPNNLQSTFIYIFISAPSDRDSSLQVRHPLTGEIVARYDGLCVKMQCNMYRVRPEKRLSAEDVKRYPRKIKIRLQEKFLRSDNYFFEDKLTKEHLKKGVWICLEHFSHVDEKSFLTNYQLPEEAALIKDNRKKCKTRIQVRLSALPPLRNAKLNIKEEPAGQLEDEDNDLQVVFEEKQENHHHQQQQEEEVQIVFASESVEKNFKLNKRLYSKQDWDPLNKIKSVPVYAMELFDHGIKCLPSVMDRFIQSLTTKREGNLVPILGASSIIFEASLRDDRQIDLQNYLDDLTYSSEARYFFLPYHLFGSWSLLTYNIDEKRADNYVLSSKYDWRVHHKVEKILYSVQDKLMLRRRGVLAKNIYRNESEVYDCPYKSAIKVMSVMREIVLGRDPKVYFLNKEACSVVFIKCIIQQILLGHVVLEGSESDLADTALFKDLDMVRPYSINNFYSYLAPSE